MNGKYDDLLHLPHHVSFTHPQMSMRDRAAQFKPFAALTGYEAMIRETGRLTEERVELDDSAKAELSWRLQVLSEILSQHPEVSATYFQPDIRKKGGAYRTVTGTVHKIDEYEGVIMMDNGTGIPIEDLFSLEGDWFPLTDSI